MKRRILIAFCLTALVLIAAVAALVWDGLHDRVGNADVALVLGNTVHPDGTPSARLQARLDAAVHFYQEGYYKLIIVSGGTGKEGVPEGDAMQRYLIQNGIPADAIIVDNEGIDTFASARNTVAILRNRNLKSVFAITQYYHIPRSKLALQKFGISPIFNGHAPYFELRDFISTLREIPAYLKYLLIFPKADASDN